MHIVHLCRIGWPHTGGLESAVDGLASALVKRGHTSRVLTLSRAITDGRQLPVAEHHGVPYARLPRLGPRRYPFMRGLAEALRGADIVHVHGLDGLLDQALATRKLHRAKVGVSTHGGYLHTRRQQGLKQLVLHLWTRPQLRRADAVWFTSRTDEVRIGGGGVRGGVLPNGVQLAPFASIVRRPEPGRWLVFGRVDEHKGHDDALRLLAHAPAHTHLHIVGEETRPGLVDRLARQAAELGLDGRYTFHGRLERAELHDHLARAAVALFPSRAEGFGIAVVESMAAGVPVAVRPIPAHRELVRHGLTGLHLPFDQPARAAAAMGDLDPVDLDQARDDAMGFDWSIMVVRWERAYESLLAP